MNPSFVLESGVRVWAAGELRFEFDRMPLVARGIEGARRRNLLKVAANRILPVTRPLGYPYMAHISPAGVCNLHCSLCPVNDPAMRGKSLLSFDTFCRLVDQVGSYLLYVILWGWGEPLLNPDLPRMCAYAQARNILTITSTNLNHLDQDLAHRLVASGLDAMIIALDGASPVTYSQYRQGGSMEKVVRHTRMLVEEKRRQGRTEPLLNLRMVVSRDNEHEVEAVRRLGRTLGVDMVSFKAFSTRQLGYAAPRWDRRYAPRTSSYRWYRYEDRFRASRAPGKHSCRFPWTKPTLFPDGTVTMCEFDFRHEFPLGNIDRESFDRIWFGPRAKAFRRQFARNRDSISFCRDCVYDFTTIPGCVLSWEWLEPHLVGRVPAWTSPTLRAPDGLQAAVPKGRFQIGARSTSRGRGN